MNEPTFFDRLGRPVDVVEWGRLSEDPGYRQIASDDMLDGLRVRTVWTGMDLGDGRRLGPPGIFETVVFDADGDAVRGERYCTEAEARRGHAEVVAALAVSSR